MGCSKFLAFVFSALVLAVFWKVHPVHCFFEVDMMRVWGGRRQFMLKGSLLFVTDCQNHLILILKCPPPPNWSPHP